MELENIVANTVLLKAREGEDGDGGADSSSPQLRWKEDALNPSKLFSFSASSILIQLRVGEEDIYTRECAPFWSG